MCGDERESVLNAVVKKGGSWKTKEKDVSDVIQFLKIYVFCVNNLSYVCISIFFVTLDSSGRDKEDFLEKSGGGFESDVGFEGKKFRILIKTVFCFQN